MDMETCKKEGYAVYVYAYLFSCWPVENYSIYIFLAGIIVSFDVVCHCMCCCKSS